MPVISTRVVNEQGQASRLPLMVRSIYFITTEPQRRRGSEKDKREERKDKLRLRLGYKIIASQAIPTMLLFLASEVLNKR